MKQSDTNAIANLYVESINRGADPSKMSHQTYFKINGMVKELKKQGVSLEDAILQISRRLEMGENTDDLEETIKEMWPREGGNSIALRMRGEHPDQEENTHEGHYPRDDWRNFRKRKYKQTSWLQPDGSKVLRTGPRR